MSDHQDKEKCPHGETGDTVQQAAEVSKPTGTVYPDLDNAKADQAPSDSTTKPDPQERAGGGAG